VLTTYRKGAIAETAIAHAAVRAGIDVYRPVLEGTGSTICVRCYSSRRTATGNTRRKYLEAEIDAIAACCPANEQSYLLPARLVIGRAEIRLRLGQALNGQCAGIHCASDCELERLNL
jgi:hypothetical protein